MMLIRQSLTVATVFNRSFSLSAVRLLDVPSSKPLSEERKAEIAESQKKMKWRKTPEEKGEWYSNFKLFMEDDNPKPKEVFITRIQKPIEFKRMKSWFTRTLEKRQRFMQQHLPERHSTLGNDLAAAHFLVHRNGRVRFQDQGNWVKMDEKDNYNLPERYVHGLFLEEIDCEGVVLYYEGLENIRRLRELKSISFKNIEQFDDWSLDRVSGAEYEKLEVLDLSGTKISHRGLQALYRIPTLKKLILTDPYRDTEWKLTLAMLQDIIPDLEIVEAQALQKSEVQ